MPSILHEALLLLFRNRVTLAPEVLRDTLRFELPRHSEVRLESAELTQIVPTEYRADLVVLLLEGKPVLAIVVEAQLSVDDGKRWSWPVYLAALRARLRCSAVLLVVTVDEATAGWAAKPIALGPPGFVLTPFVLGPARVPVVRDEAAAMAAPELAVLSAIAHGRDSVDTAVPIATAAITAVLRLDEERADLYADLVLSRLGPAAKVALEAWMESGKYEYQSDFARKYFGQGKAEGKAEAVLAVLAARQVAVPDALRDRVVAETDLALLDRWLARAATCASAEEVLRDEH